MIKVFNETDTTFETNGEVVLNPTYAVVHKEDNGDYYLDLETQLTDETKTIPYEEGSIATINVTGQITADSTKESHLLSLEGETQQDSTTGKQLLDINSSSFNTQTINGVTITNMGDGSIKLNGTVTGNEFSVRVTKNIPSEINSGIKYYLKANTLSGTSDTYSKIIFGSLNGGPTNTLINSKNEENNFKTSSNYNLIWLYIYAGTGKTFNNLIIKPILSTFEDTEWEKYTGNAPSPSPSYPQDIHNVSGDNTIEICGKNLSIKNVKGYFSSNSTKIAVDGDSESFVFYATQGQTYTYSSLEAMDRSLIAQVDTLDIVNNTPITNVRSLSGNKTFTSDFTGYCLIYVNSTLNDNIKNSFQVEVGNEATTYEAYTSQTQLISLGVENYCSNVTKPANANLRFTFDKSIPKTITISFTSNEALSGNSLYLEVDGTSLGNIGGITGNANTRVSRTLELSDTNYQAIKNGTNISLLLYKNGANFDIPNDAQIENGSKLNSYTPYGTTPIWLGEIGDYQDYIYPSNDRWFLHKEIGKVVLDGTEDSWVSWGSDAKGYKLNNIPNGNGTNDSVVYPIYSNYFKAEKQSDIFTNKTGIQAFGGTYNAIYIRDNNTSTLNDFKTWLSTHNTIVYYVLSTPTDTEITNEELLGQLNSIKVINGLNNISVNSPNLIPPIQIQYNHVTGGEVSTNDYIQPNKILVANTPTGNQPFRITNIEKNRRRIRLQAKHLTYDSENYVIEDSFVVDKTCNQALDHLNNATDNTSPFTTTSDITTINSYRCVRKSLWEAINVVLERWGGHLTRNNWQIGIMNSIGQDNGVVVRYAKNLKNIDVQYDWSQVVTKILPVGEDGLLLDEVFLYADIQYDIPYTKVVKFDQNIDDEPYRDEDGVLDEDAYKEALKADLRSQATAYLQEHYIPQVNYELNANLEKITDIGDTIQVKDERLGIDLLTNLISYDYDCILEKYKTLEFGNFRKTISDLTTYINTQTNSIVNDSVTTTRITLQNELETATSQIWGVLGNSYVINEGDKILIVDSLPKETATNVWMFNNGGLAFSNTGINGTFKQAWTIDGTFNTQNINVINFTADLIKGGTLKLGSNVNQNGILEVYDEANNLIALLNKDGLRMNAVNGDYVLINQNVGFAGYDRNNVKIYWVDGDEFHMKKSVVEEEITLVDKMRIIPITITDEYDQIINDGIGFVSTL